MIDTNHLSAAGTLSGCTPAFTAMYLEALGDAGIKYGLTRAASYRIAAKMLCGTGKLYLQTGTHPGAMKDAVCSPGGTTIRGVSHWKRRVSRGGHSGPSTRSKGNSPPHCGAAEKICRSFFCANILTFIDLCAILISINIDGR